MLWKMFKEKLNVFLKKITDNNDDNYACLKFNDSKTYYQGKKNDLFKSWVNLKLWKIFDELELKSNRKYFLL